MSRAEQVSYDDMRKRLNDSLKRFVPAEFINRLDSVVIFRSLNKNDIEQIVSLELARSRSAYRTQPDAPRNSRGPVCAGGTRV